jgi:hypothetical protein
LNLTFSDGKKVGKNWKILQFDAPLNPPCLATFFQGKMREIPLLLGFEYSCANANNLSFVYLTPQKIKYYSIPKFSPVVHNTTF